MRKLRRLRLLDLLLRPGSPNPDGFCFAVLPSPLSYRVETGQAHPNTLNHVLGWTCRESHPGPRYLHLEGITTILLLYYLLRDLSRQIGH